MNGGRRLCRPLSSSPATLPAGSPPFSQAMKKTAHDRDSRSRAEKLIYTARTHTTGGREGESRSDDGRLQVKLDRPGTPGMGMNPEQLFAAGWSACFEEAMSVAARKRRVVLPPETSLDAEVDLLSGDGVYTLAARLNIRIPGMDRETAQAIIDDAHGDLTLPSCPTSSARRLQRRTGPLAPRRSTRLGSTRSRPRRRSPRGI